MKKEDWGKYLRVLNIKWYGAGIKFEQIAQQIESIGTSGFFHHFSAYLSQFNFFTPKH